MTLEGIRNSRQKPPTSGSNPLFWAVLASLACFTTLTWPELPRRNAAPTATHTEKPIPLVMEGGDPYIRALMRTISASESNVTQPYSVIYGGQYVSDLQQHPEICVTIRTGPNTGNCSTAAGRYQMINTTWFEVARRYHPNPDRFLWQTSGYSFEAEYQDQVVYAWLNDTTAWGMNIPQQLRQGNLDQVLRHLSSTWTSLGYGIENNSMSSHLPAIYKRMLREELKTVQS